LVNSPVVDRPHSEHKTFNKNVFKFVSPQEFDLSPKLGTIFDLSPKIGVGDRSWGLVLGQIGQI
jgi:hypothetical protein